ncbi:MAG: hypothetical protein WBF33_17420 [Candidatus Nitrosopolaris sp.]
MISLISIPHVFASAYVATNSTSPLPIKSHIRGSTSHYNATGATSTPSINSMDYKHGYQVGLSLAENCIYHAVLSGSNLFKQGFFDGYQKMNVTKRQWKPSK